MTDKYPKGVKVSDAQLGAVNLTCHTFHGDWNYTIAPRSRPSDLFIYGPVLTQG